MKVDWRTQLIAHALNDFYKQGSCSNAHLVYDWIEETKKIEIDAETKKKCWVLAKKESTDNGHKAYKKRLLYAYLNELLKQNIVVETEVKPLTLRIKTN
jgi:hypothetical protein